jgi:hypothetical protein
MERAGRDVARGAARGVGLLVVEHPIAVVKTTTADSIKTGKHL